MKLIIECGNKYELLSVMDKIRDSIDDGGVEGIVGDDVYWSFKSE